MFKKTVFLLSVLAFSCNAFAQADERDYNRAERNERIRTERAERAERTPTERAERPSKPERESSYDRRTTPTEPRTERPRREPSPERQWQEQCQRKAELEVEKKRMERSTFDKAVNVITNGSYDKIDKAHLEQDKIQCKDKNNRIEGRDRLKDPASYDNKERTPRSSGRGNVVIQSREVFL